MMDIQYIRAHQNDGANDWGGSGRQVFQDPTKSRSDTPGIRLWCSSMIKSVVCEQAS